MSSREITLTLVPPGKSSIDVDNCDGCQYLRTGSPIFYSLMLELFGIIDTEEEKSFLLKYHFNGHEVFARTDQPKQIESNKRLLGLMD